MLLLTPVEITLGRSSPQDIEWAQSFRDTNDLTGIVGSGWGPQFDWGILQNSRRSTLRLALDRTRSQDLIAKLSGRIHRGATDQSVAVTVNGQIVAALDFSLEYPIKSSSSCCLEPPSTVVFRSSLGSR